MPRPADHKLFFYEAFADQFDERMNMYDTRKRLRIVYEELLSEPCHGKLALDAGCGTGWFSQAAEQRGARVVALDLGPRLLARVAQKCHAMRTAGSILELPFADDTFDLVISSEVLEHIPDAGGAIREFHRVLKPGGVLLLTTPNKRWHFAIWWATTLRLRPYRGLENWVGWSELQRLLNHAGLTIEEMKGFHLVPFVSPLLYPVLDWCDRFGHALGPVMLNMAVRCRKPRSLSP